ncbi:MAG: hypothetical protein FWC82_01440, partial [Firmicutes bacterium]|nr:hypothetical protein [Bacillota bacterium]
STLQYLDGFNVTKPHKKNILPFITSNESAVNTVVKNSHTHTGYNTDYDGFKLHVEELSTSLKGKTVLVLGAGGVAESIVPVLKQKGANVFVHSVFEEEAKEFAARHSVEIALTNEGQYNVVVNATVLGLHKGENPAPKIDLSKTELVYDAIYFETDFLKMARESKVKFVENGLDMLIYQAIAADEYFLNIKIPDKKELKEVIKGKLIL